MRRQNLHNEFVSFSSCFHFVDCGRPTKRSTDHFKTHRNRGFLHAGWNGQQSNDVIQIAVPTSALRVLNSLADRTYRIAPIFLHAAKSVNANVRYRAVKAASMLRAQTGEDLLPVLVWTLYDSHSFIRREAKAAIRKRYIIAPSEYALSLVNRSAWLRDADLQYSTQVSHRTFDESTCNAVLSSYFWFNRN